METALVQSREKSSDASFCKYLARQFNCSSGRAGKPAVKWTEVAIILCQFLAGLKPLKFEAKSAKDEAWFDVETFLAHRYNCSDDPVSMQEVLIRFAGYGPEEDEWVDVKNSVRQCSAPFENSHCHGIEVGDQVLCIQETRSKALLYDAQVLDVQRKVHDLRGCRCLFLVRYKHHNTEVRVPLKKLCRIQEYYCFDSEILGCIGVLG